MKRLIHIFTALLCFSTFINAQEFEFPLYFEDFLGEKDTIFLGYDVNATVGIDESFGEINIKGTPLVGLDVRIINYWYTGLHCDAFVNVDSSSFHTKRQITDGSCAMPVFPALGMIIAKERFPVKISWDKENFPDACGTGPVLTDWHPGGWFDAPCDNTQAVVLLSTVDSISFQTTAIDLVTAENDTVNYLFFSFYDISDATNNINDQESITIFPNPATNNQIHLQSDHLPSNAEVHIYSTLGQLLSIEKWTESRQAFTLPHSGVFYVAVFSEGKRVAVRKVVGVE